MAKSYEKTEILPNNHCKTAKSVVLMRKIVLSFFQRSSCIPVCAHTDSDDAREEENKGVNTQKETEYYPTETYRHYGA